jgi:MFS family permease
MPQRIVALFDRSESASSAVARLESFGLRPEVGRASDRRLAARGEQRQEAADVGSTGVVVGAIPGPMARGALVGALTGAVLGAALGASVGAVLAGVMDLADWDWWQISLLLAAIGAIAVGAAGFVYGGARRPEQEHDGEPTDHDVTVAVRLTDDRQAGTIEQVLRDAGARMVTDDLLRPQG